MTFAVLHSVNERCPSGSSTLACGLLGLLCGRQLNVIQVLAEIDELGTRGSISVRTLPVPEGLVAQIEEADPYSPKYMLQVRQ